MSATTWLIIAIVGFSLSGVALVTAVFMFIKMNIPAVIGDLTGKTVAREIKAMRDSNASSGNKLHGPSRVNANRGKLTDKAGANDSSVRAAAHASKRLDTTGGRSSFLKKGKTGGKLTGRLETDVLNTVPAEQSRATDVLPQNKATELLVEDRKTDVLSSPQATDVLSEARQTEVLSEVRQTEVLSENEPAPAAKPGTTILSETEEVAVEKKKPVAFKVTKMVIKTHTDEVIQ